MIVVRCRSLAMEDPRGVTLLETQLASLFWEEVEQEIMLIGVCRFIVDHLPPLCESSKIRTYYLNRKHRIR